MKKVKILLCRPIERARNMKYKLLGKLESPIDWKCFKRGLIWRRIYGWDEKQLLSGEQYQLLFVQMFYLSIFTDMEVNLKFSWFED